jgi:O-succinylbenzoate synthase
MDATEAPAPSPAQPTDGPAAALRMAYAVPLRRRFRGLTVRSGLLVRGPAGWGEFSPFDDYSAPQVLPWWRSTYEAAWIGWPPPVRDRIPVNATVPAVPADDVAAVLAAFPGCTTAKVKVAEAGETEGDDLERVAAVRDVLGPGGRIRIDANTGWDARTAARRLAALDRAAGGLEYAEQPCPSIDELALLRRLTHVPIAADESIRRSSDPMAVVRAGAADIAVLKVAPLGGVRACLRLAERLGLPVVVSSALESSVGMAAGLALAAALPELPYACGLGTVGLFERDVVDVSLLPVDGYLPVPTTAPAPHQPLGDDVSADPELSNRWEKRYTAVLTGKIYRPVVQA